MAAPVKATCPDIDKYIKWIKGEIVRERDIKNMTEQELIDTCSSMNSQLESCIDYLEELRESNGLLREWGEGLECDVEDAANKINDLENKIDELQSTTPPSLTNK